MQQPRRAPWLRRIEFDGSRAAGRRREELPVWRDFFPRIAKAYLIGEAAQDFARTLAMVPHEIVGTLEAATTGAIEEAREGETVLLSPGCASFDQFSDYEERGHLFRNLVSAHLQKLGAANVKEHEMARNSAVADLIFDQWWRSVDRVLVAAVTLLLVAGTVLSFASSPALADKHGLASFHFALRHGAHALLALIFMAATSLLTERGVRRCGILFFAVALLAMALLPWFGTDFGKGSIRWYSLGFMSLQPSEFVKIGFILTIAWFLSGTVSEPAPPGKPFPSQSRCWWPDFSPCSRISGRPP